jgi:hypothetical protein
LFICCARNGKDSDAWKQAVRTMDELIWSVKPKSTPEDRQRLVRIQPKLIQNLRSGMERLSISATERDDFIAKLVHAHGRTAVAPAPDTASTAPDPNAVAVPLAASGPEPAAPGRNSDAIRSMPDPTASHYLQQAQRLKPGTWLEFVNSNGRVARAKLSWISPITGTLLFTDRTGLKAGNYEPAELARMLAGRLARVLDTAPLMDRAVNDGLSGDPGSRS